MTSTTQTFWKKCYSLDFGEGTLSTSTYHVGLWQKDLVYFLVIVFRNVNNKLVNLCILLFLGLAYNGEIDGEPQWNGVENIKLYIFENTTEFNHYILAFNVNTNQWVAHYIYKRLKFLGNRHISQLAALSFLAIWHGLHSGYYVCFFLEFIVIYMERDVSIQSLKEQKIMYYFNCFFYL